MTEATLTIENKTGIHARPASVFVQTAAKFKSKVQVKAKGKTADAKRSSARSNQESSGEMFACAPELFYKDSSKSLCDI